MAGFNIDAPEDKPEVRSTCLIERVAPSLKVRRRIEIVMGDDKVATDALIDQTLEAFIRLDSRINEYDGGE